MIENLSKKYIKLSGVEHVLKRPDTYIGSLAKEKIYTYVSTNYDNIKNVKMEYKEISYSPGFLKIFDECLVNASDHVIRTKQVSYIKVHIDDNYISVENDGPGIPIVVHEKEKIYIVEMIMGNLLSGSNFDDEEERFVGGRNGIGIKSTNIFSKQFEVETADGNKIYKQKFTNNMSKVYKPYIRKSKKNYTKITFYPDFEKFDMDKIDSDTMGMLVKRVCDISAYNKGIKVYLNGKIIPIKSFKDYMKLFVSSDDEIFYEKINDYWEVGVIKSPIDSFTQISMVNGVSTIAGGTHINFVSNYLTNNIKSNILKGHKDINIKPLDIKNRMLLFVNTKMINPIFNSQTKENLTSKLNGNIKDFILSDKLLKKISNDQMFSDLIELSILKEQLNLKKELNNNVSKRIRIDKLNDANKAGTIESDKCYLFLTEGDSALSFVRTGFSEIGRDYYGAFPLKGKPLNVRDVSLLKIKNNIEIKNIIQILGLEFGKKYKNTKSLRYGNVVITTDADVDGYHIKGLLINLFDTFWPELLTLNYLFEFVSPILRVKNNNKKKFFYKISDYEKWLLLNKDKNYTVKYFKGLGTSEPVDIKKFFKNIDKHLIKFNYSNAEKTEDLIDLAFRKKRADDRKNWLLNYNPNTVIDKFTKKTTYDSFMDKEFIEYSMADNIRNIPSIMDGFKPTQRKILCTLFKSNSKDEVNVSQLFGRVKDIVKYHHGTASLDQGIINMAQDFVGSNNISLLEPIGGFGTRLSGGKDSSSSRYIHTKMRNITRLIFIPVDNNIIEYNEDEGKIVEPKFYIPIIPNILLNSSYGVGTGWSSFIPSFKIEDLIDYVDNKLNGKKKNIILNPFYEGFKGTIIYDDANDVYITKGIINRINTTTLTITELPIGVWNDNYYLLLDKLIDKKIIKSYVKHCTDLEVNIIVRISRENLQSYTDDDLYNTFELTSKLNISNMHLFDINSKIKKYENQYEIIDEYFVNRIDFYNDRKAYILNKLNNRFNHLKNLMKFIKLILNGTIVINNIPMDKILISLETNKLDKIEDSYNYLLSIPLYKLSKEELVKLKNEFNDLKSEIQTIVETPIEKMWHQDLLELKKEVRRFRKEI